MKCNSLVLNIPINSGRKDLIKAINEYSHFKVLHLLHYVFYGCIGCGSLKSECLVTDHAQ